MSDRVPIPTSVWNFLRYDPESGKLYWVVGRRCHVSAGDEAGSLTRDGYLKVKVEGRVYLAHRLAWFAVYGDQPHILDHIDGNPANNRVENLRPATQRQNGKNVAAVGASYDPKRGKWMARICVDYKHINLGRYATREDAVRVAQAARREHFGEFARVVQL